jgi:type IV pilus assembly protein PilE
MKIYRGFTLIELMIVVAIVAILAAIAYPSYARYVEQARRADGKAALLDAAQRLERCYTQQNTYVGCTIAASSSDGYYDLAFAAGSPEANAFTITAIPQGAQANSPCGTYELQSDGTRDVSGGLGPERCW